MWSSESNGNYDVNCFFFCVCWGGGVGGDIVGYEFVIRRLQREVALMSCLQVVFKFGRLVFFKMIFFKTYLSFCKSCNKLLDVKCIILNSPEHYSTN